METSGLSTLNHLNQGRSAADRIESTAEKHDGDEKSFSIDSSSSTSDSAGTEKKNEKLMKAANKVEGFFISFMMKQMCDTVKHTEGLFDRGQAEKMFQSRLDNKYAEGIAKSKDFGLAESVYDQFSAIAK